MENNTNKSYSSISKQMIVNNRTLLFRFLWLFISAFVGIYLALLWFAEEVLPSWLIIIEITSFKEGIGLDKSIWLDSSLTTLLLVLPTLLFLWIFRTHDTREQIRTTQNNTLSSILTHALDMISSNDLKRRSMGLVQLAQLKKQTKDFDARIDAATRGLNLSEDPYLSKRSLLEIYKLSPLIYSSLENMDLSGANLSSANLSGANLSGASLICTVLIGSFLTNVNLRDVKDLSGAIYNDETQFPKGFNPEARGMVKIVDQGVDDRQSEG